MIVFNDPAENSLARPGTKEDGIMLPAGWKHAYDDGGAIYFYRPDHKGSVTRVQPMSDCPQPTLLTPFTPRNFDVAMQMFAEDEIGKGEASSSSTVTVPMEEFKIKREAEEDFKEWVTSQMAGPEEVDEDADHVSCIY